MARERLSQLQQRILAWLAAEERRTRGTMTAEHRRLVRALRHDKGNLSTSLRNLETKGLVTLARTPGGKVEAIDLTAEGRTVAEVVNKEIVARLAQRNRALHARIHALHAQGLTKRQIAHRLNQEGVPAGTESGRWHEDTVLAWLVPNAGVDLMVIAPWTTPHSAQRRPLAGPTP